MHSVRPIRSLKFLHRDDHSVNKVILVFVVSCKTRNHPQTTQTTHKPPTNYPQISQTTHKPTKLPTNHANIWQCTHLSAKYSIFRYLKTFFMIRYKFRTQQPQYLPSHKVRPYYPSRTRREMGASFWCSCQILDFAFSIAQFFSIPHCRPQS